MRRRSSRWSLAVVGALVGGLLQVGAQPAVAALAGPALVSPSAGQQVAAMPPFTWRAVAGAVRYHFDVSPDPGFGSGTIGFDTVNTHATVATPMTPGELHWRVAAVDSANVLGSFTTGSFVLDPGAPPTLLGPTDGATLNYPEQAPLFTWTAVPGAQSYELEIANDDAFGTPTKLTTVNTAFTPTVNQVIAFGQQASWRVRAVYTDPGSSSRVNGDFSAVHHYTLVWATGSGHTPAVPSLSKPASGSTVTDVVLEWTPVLGAATYQVQVSSNQDFANNVVVDKAVYGNRYTPPVTLDNSSYFWRVRALTGDTPAIASAWSNSAPGQQPWSFTRDWPDRPTLLPIDPAAPTDEAIYEPRFRWTAVPHASQYELQVGTDPAFSDGTYNTCQTDHTSYTPYVNYPQGLPICRMFELNLFTTRLHLHPGRTHYWRVRGIDTPKPISVEPETNVPAGVRGLWSESRSFVYKTGLPSAVSPLDGAETPTPSLAWDAVPGAEYYRVYISGPTFMVVNGTQTYSPSFTPTMPLATNTNYTWWVQSFDIDGGGLMVNSLARRTFKLVPVTSGGALAVSGPANGAPSQRYPALSWSPVAARANGGSVRYRVSAGPTGGTVETILAENLPFAGYTHTAIPPSAGTYSWHVTAYDNLGTIADSGNHTYTIVNTSDATYVAPATCDPQTPGSCTALPDTPRLEWNRVTGASSYLVYMSQDAAFTSQSTIVYRTNRTSFTPKDSLLDNQADAAWYWYVRPCKTPTVCSPTRFSDAQAFRKRSVPVVQIEPQHHAEDDTTPPPAITSPTHLLFTWQRYQETVANRPSGQPRGTLDAAQYRIQVSDTADFSRVLNDAPAGSLTDETAWAPAGVTLPDGPLFWRVAAIDGTSNQLTWSATRRLVKTTPAIVGTRTAPAGDGSVPAFHWTPAAFAARYQLEVYKNADQNYSPTNLAIPQVATRMAVYTPTLALAGGEYAWRIRPVDGFGRPSAWTPGGLFTVRAPAPTLVAPASGAAVSNADRLFVWTPATGAAKYAFQKRLVGGAFSMEVTTPGTAHAPTTGYANGTYEWRVAALNAAGQVLSYSSTTRTFIIDATKPSVASKAPLTALPLAGPFSATFSEAVKGVTTSTFRVVVTGTTTPVPGRVTVTSTTARWTPTATLVPGRSYTASLTSGITDAAGNPLTPVTWTVRATTTVESGSPAIRTLWDRDASSAANGGYYINSRTAGAAVTLSFTGTAVTAYGMTAPSGGLADVYIDGVRQKTISFYSATTTWKRAVYARTGLTNKAHTIKIVALGTKQAAATATAVVLDAFQVGATVYQENHGAVRTEFRHVRSSSAYGGYYDNESQIASGDTSTKPTYTLTFVGTGVGWDGIVHASAGKAAVYIDGVYRQTVDTYSATAARRRVYSSPVLTSGTHTISIMLLGTRHTSSRGYWVAVDRLVVR